MNIVFFILLPVLGGLIAYFADRLGRNLGKKRLSLFNMRPRHTAEFLTVMAGALIPLATVIIVMTGSADVREWLLRGPAILGQRDQAERDLKSSQLQITVVERQLKEDKALLEAANRKLQDTSARLRGLTTRVAELNAKLASETNKVSVAEGKFGAVQTKFLAANQRLVVATRDYQRAQQDFSRVKTDLNKLQANKNTLDTEYSQLKVSYKALDELRHQADSRVTQANTEIADDNAKLADLNTRLGAASENLRRAQSDYETVQGQLLTVRSQLDAAIADIKAAGFAVDINRSLANITRLRPVLVGAGDELSRVMIPAGTGEPASKKLLDDGLARANQYVISQGTTIRLSINNDNLDFQKQENRVLTAVTNSPKAQVVIMSSFWNTVKDDHDFVAVVLSVEDDPIVYHANQRIAETAIQGSLPEDQIIQQITDFLQKQVRTRATTDKMIPIAGREEQFGSVSFAEIYALVKRIHEWGRNCSLIAYADKDTHAADPLVLRFQLR